MRVDIAIITIREDEFTAVRERFQTRRYKTAGGRSYLVGEVTAYNQRVYTFAIARSIEQGNNASQRLTHYIIEDLDPQLILLVGIAGGVPHNEFTLGDVIVSTHIVNPNIDARNADGTTDYMVGGGSLQPLVEHIISLLPGEPQLNNWNRPPSFQLERPEVDLQQSALHENHENKEWHQRVQESLIRHFEQEPSRHRLPLFKMGPIISSNHLLKDPFVLVDLLKTHRAILAVEMEAAGVYEAARRPDRSYPVMVIRGISDIVGLPRDEHWTAFACQTAAAFASTLIRAALIDPREVTESSESIGASETQFHLSNPYQDQIRIDKSLAESGPSLLEAKITQPLSNLSKIEHAINNIGPNWILCFIGEDQTKKLAALTQDLRGKFSKTGDGKQIASGFSYWGISPTVAWALACNDPFYLVMRESIESFKDQWSDIFTALNNKKYHYVSLGVGTGHKDRDVLKDLYQIYPDLYYFPVDISPEMLRIGIQEAVKGIPLERRKILSIQLDFSIKTNVEAYRNLLNQIVDNEPIIFSLLGNTLANFEKDETLLTTLALLLRPQDRLLVEVAYTETLDDEAAQEAAEEYSKSRPFREFVTSALRQNTDLRVRSKDVSFVGTIESDRNLRVKALYQNKNAESIEISLPDRTTVDFLPEDTIRLYLSRKYTSNGIKSLIAACGLTLLKRKRSIFDPAQSHFDFGIELMLLAPTKSKATPRNKEKNENKLK